MRTRHKRLIVIAFCIAWGMLIPISASLLPDSFWNWTPWEYEEMNFWKKLYLKILAYTVSFASKIDYNFFDGKKQSIWRFGFIQLFVYTVIGMIVSFAAYSPFRRMKPSQIPANLTEKKDTEK